MDSSVFVKKYQQSCQERGREEEEAGGGDAVGAVPVASIGGGSSVDVVYSGQGYGTECASMVSFFSFFFSMQASGAARRRMPESNHYGMLNKCFFRLVRALYRLSLLIVH
jgi:hypothetical protein